MARRSAKREWKLPLGADVSSAYETSEKRYTCQVNFQHTPMRSTQLVPLSLPPRAGVFFTYTPAFIAELADYLQGKRVLETFAGNGYLAALLAAKGISVTATSLFRGMDASDFGQSLYHPVEELSAVEAVTRYGADHDVLLMSWPTVTEQAFIAARLMGKPVVVIGEFTDYSIGQLGGCATDDFWAHARPEKVFSTYRSRGPEAAQVVEMQQEPNPAFLMALIAWQDR